MYRKRAILFETTIADERATQPKTTNSPERAIRRKTTNFSERAIEHETTNRTRAQPYNRKTDLMTTQTTDPLTLTEQSLDRTCERLGTAVGLLELWAKSMTISEPCRSLRLDILTARTNEWIKEQANERT